MSVAVVVGNPKPRSRTLQAAHLVARRLTGQGPDLTLDLADIGPALLDWSNVAVTALVGEVQSRSVAIFASPTYKGSFTGLLKLFLDRMGSGALTGTTAVPLMLGGDQRHSLAPEVFLKPVLNELGASLPTPGLFLLEEEWDQPSALEPWLQRARPALARTVVAAR